MNILIQLSHPAHFHLYKNAARNLIADGHQVHILIKSKDILEDLLKESDLPYENICTKAHRGNKLGILLDMLEREYKMFKYCRKNKIDLLTGSTPEVAHVGWLLGKYRINTGEDDAAVVPLFGRITAPFLQTMLSPVVCDNGSYEKKTIKYYSYHELAYLHPNNFIPDKKTASKYINADEKYFLLRFAKLKAYHDDNIRGIDTSIARKLLQILEPEGKIYITSERELEPEFEKYRININPLDIHHVMAYAALCIGDSQTMAAEAGVLGVPFIRFNDFVGRIGYLNELENKYQLGKGIHPSKPDDFLQEVANIARLNNSRSIYQDRREEMLKDKVDYSKLLTWFIEEYPNSAKIMRDNPSYQMRFK